MGALHPELLKQFDLQGPVYVFELDFALNEQEKLAKFQRTI
jgi:phenylalanyl-tRNA synthetase beta subunit